MGTREPELIYVVREGGATYSTYDNNLGGGASRVAALRSLCVGRGHN